MSGKDERPNSIPECDCDTFKTWIIWGTVVGKSIRLMYVNVNSSSARLSYGMWNVLGNKKAYIMRKAQRMYCGGCDKKTSITELGWVLKVFENLYSGD